MAVAQPPSIFGLLSDPLRWQVVVELGRSDRRAGELVELTAKPQNLVSYHLAELRRAGLVTARRSSADGRDVYYRVDLSRCRELLGEAGLSLHPGIPSHRMQQGVTTSMCARPRVLFLCTGNSARSQIAEALIQHRSGGMVHARSAGSHPKTLHPSAVRVLARRSIDISGRTAKPVTRFARSRFDRIVTLCDKVREICPEFPGAPITSHWSIADPATAGDDDAIEAAFQRVTDEIDDRIGLLLAELWTPPPQEKQHG
ncbi:MAG: ArsR family transcriptional regulator [Ilumatobacteraceae bacterium]|nr:ArsR family transcriptional regulator [Ilumatobacteraceae bacterium]